MDKKIIVGIIIIIACIVVGAIFLSQSNNINTSNNTVPVGNSSNSYIVVPSGFNFSINNSNKVVLDNGKSTFAVYEIKNQSIDDIFNQYHNTHKNDTVKESTNDINGVTVRGLTLVVNNTVVHTNYFYQKDGVTFQIFPSGKDDQLAFNQIVSSTKVNSV